MEYNYKILIDNHNKCASLVNRLCELDSKYNWNKDESALCVMKNAIEDIGFYFKDNQHSRESLCFLIRNLDVIITGILDLNNDLFGVGLNRQKQALMRCFDNYKIIDEFRTLRSLILAHPVDTYFINENNERETIYLEDILLENFFMVQNFKDEDYILKKCSPKTKNSHFDLLSIDKNIIPVITEIANGIQKLIIGIDNCIKSKENELRNVPLIVCRDTITEYINSLDKELEKRYPSCVTNEQFEDGTIKHHSIVYECLTYFEAPFLGDTRIKYNEFLDYIKLELETIENDLQNMTYDVNEDVYFNCLNHNLNETKDYENQKIIYLKDSNEFSYTSKSIPNSTDSDILWGIQQFNNLKPDIEKYITVDTSVQDKFLYCEYIAAVYLSNKKI